jgi:hypothetical protein
MESHGSSKVMELRTTNPQERGREDKRYLAKYKKLEVKLGNGLDGRS